MQEAFRHKGEMEKAMVKTQFQCWRAPGVQPPLKEWPWDPIWMMKLLWYIIVVIPTPIAFMVTEPGIPCHPRIAWIMSTPSNHRASNSHGTGALNSPQKTGVSHRSRPCGQWGSPPSLCLQPVGSVARDLHQKVGPLLLIYVESQSCHCDRTDIFGNPLSGFRVHLQESKPKF